MENFRRSTRRNDQRNILAKSVRSNWLTSDYFFGPSSPATKEAQAEVLFCFFCLKLTMEQGVNIRLDFMLCFSFPFSQSLFKTTEPRVR